MRREIWEESMSALIPRRTPVKGRAPPRASSAANFPAIGMLTGKASAGWNRCLPPCGSETIYQPGQDGCNPRTDVYRSQPDGYEVRADIYTRRGDVYSLRADVYEGQADVYIPDGDVCELRADV